MDVAQAGASCPTLPFTITEIYTPESVSGLYNKNAAMPGGKLLNLATVVVDVQPEYMILFSCIDVAITHVTEVVIATRQRTPGQEAVANITSTAHALGVPFADKDLSRVNWSSCK